ncbi:MAG: DUF799 family lipoprotein [Phycisphaerae bacterium]|nr:DUF799 family lipoprotein [Phycisphaerae bacterium]
MFRLLVVMGFRTAVVGTALLLLGCSGNAVTIKTVEPGVTEVVGIERLAVVDLVYKEDPEAGRDIANMIVAELNETGAFAVMERSAVTKILQEQQFGASGMVDTATVTSIGKLLGVDGVIVGEIVAFGANSKILGKEASVCVNIRLVKVESGRVIFSDSIMVNTTKSQGGENKNAMLNRVARDVAKQFVSSIAPHYVERQKFLLSTGGDVGKTNSRGITFARNNLWDKAQEQFTMAATADPTNAAVQNNLAVCAEQFGRVKQALEFYEKAIALDPDDEAIQKNLATIRTTFRGPERPAKELLDELRKGASQPASGPATGPVQ